MQAEMGENSGGLGMSYHVRKLVVGKGKTLGDEERGEWIRQYYELEIEIQEEGELAQAKEDAEILLDKWLSKKQAIIGEEVFNILKWEPEKGPRLGDYEVSYKAHNTLDKWLHAYNILKANNAVISNHFREEGYQHHYWIYPEKYNDRIFRKRREKSE